MRDAHVRPELSAASEMRHGRTDRLRRRGHPFGDHRRADHRRHDEHVVARADPAVGPAIAVEARPIAHRFHRAGAHRSPLRSSGGSARRGCELRRRRFEIAAAAVLATLCVCTCAPAGDVRRRQADRASVFDHRFTRARSPQGDLCPDGTASRTAITWSPSVEVASRLQRLQSRRDVVALVMTNTGFIVLPNCGPPERPNYRATDTDYRATEPRAPTDSPRSPGTRHRPPACGRSRMTRRRTRGTPPRQRARRCCRTAASACA